MNLQNGKFTISYPEHSTAPVTLVKDALVIGRLQSNDVVLNHHSVSRVHAGINRVESQYLLINLSTANSLTLNGKLLSAEEVDVLADGDIVQIGPFTITFARHDNELELTVVHQFTGDLKNTSSNLPSLDQIMPDRSNREAADVLKVFWEKRTREKEDWGTRLRPAEKPQPGKAMINWKPTRDLQRPWRFGLFIWSFLVIGVLAVVAFYKYPQAYVGRPLSNPHIKKLDSGSIANRGNENSCTTCHAPDRPMENACITCHQAEQFHPSNTRAHESAGVTCTVCHLEHQGADFELRNAAIKGCADCHSDSNRQTYNGKTVQTAHGGTFGVPVKDGKWVWKGIYSEILETIPTLNAERTKDESGQMRLSRQFHAVHLFRLKAPEGMSADASNRVSCSTCHKSFEPVDRESPYQTCAACHNGLIEENKVVIEPEKANCVSCHVQHPYSQNRWSEFLTDDAKNLRKRVIDLQIKRFGEK